MPIVIVCQSDEEMSGIPCDPVRVEDEKGQNNPEMDMDLIQIVNDDNDRAQELGIKKFQSMMREIK